MADAKKYYWLKLKKDFFKRHDIRIIEGMPNGKDYILFYLKLLLESIDHDGALRFSETIPYNEQMIAVVTNTNIDIVRSAMKIFIQLEMMEMLDDQTIHMTEVNKMLGSETVWAEKKRKYREKAEDARTLSSPCPLYVRQEEEEREREQNSFIHSSAGAGAGAREGDAGDAGDADNLTDRERVKRKYLGGELGHGVVMLSDEQFDNLLDKLSIEEFNKYVEIVANCELSGQKYKKKTHYRAILDMAKADRKVLGG